MPTGYTAKLVDKGQSFYEFVMTCARAFGACITMRDDGLETPIPSEFKVDSYYFNSFANANRKYADLAFMSSKEKQAFGKAKKEQALKDNLSYLAKIKEENKRIQDMIEQVKAWEPPSKDHIELKNFMLQQLEVSLSTTKYTEQTIEEIRSKTSRDFYNDALENAKRDVQYYSEKLSEQLKRADSSNQWLKQLRDSI